MSRKRITEHSYGLQIELGGPMRLRHSLIIAGSSTLAALLLFGFLGCSSQPAANYAFYPVSSQDGMLLGLLLETQTGRYVILHGWKPAASGTFETAFELADLDESDMIREMGGKGP